MAIYELDGQAPETPADGNYFIADDRDGDRQGPFAEFGKRLVRRGAARRQ